MIIEKIKSDKLVARKKGETGLVSYLSFLIGEIEKIGKNSGNRETTNDEAIVVIKKALSKVEETMVNLGITEPKLSSNPIIFEYEYLKNLLPPMIDVETIKEKINSLIKDGNNKGSIMKILKSEFGPSIDMKSAGSLVDEALK